MNKTTLGLFLALESCSGAPQAKDAQPTAPVVEAPKPTDVARGRIDKILKECPAPEGISPTIQITAGNTFARGGCKGERTENGTERHINITGTGGTMDISIGSNSKEGNVYLLTLNDGEVLVDADTSQEICRISIDHNNSVQPIDSCTSLIIDAQNEVTDRF